MLSIQADVRKLHDELLADVSRLFAFVPTLKNFAGALQTLDPAFCESKLRLEAL